MGLITCGEMEKLRFLRDGPAGGAHHQRPKWPNWWEQKEYNTIRIDLVMSGDLSRTGGLWECRENNAISRWIGLREGVIA